MKVERIDNPHIDRGDLVTVTEAGNICEVRRMKHQHRCNAIKLDAARYVVVDTGEVKDYTKKIKNRAEDLTSVRKSLKRLRELLNTNVTDAKKALWLTLTYKENMRSTEKLYSDFKQFIARLRRYLEKQNEQMKFEYIVTMEPQGRGAWHAHCVLIFDKRAPFIENQTMRKLWGHGFVNVVALREVDNVGAYLSAYLGDMELAEAVQLDTLTNAIKEVETSDSNGEKSKKYYIKGARLKLYPPSFRLFRCSRGIKQPTVYTTTNHEAMQRLEGARLTYEKTIKLLDDDGGEINTINYRQFNRNRG